ncbi:hypothetical protein LDENG_00114750 [Lucifuga dentata]|nr:hypothetical protein LDENG_00114750 [Lucifuga dentata]
MVLPLHILQNFSPLTAPPDPSDPPWHAGCTSFRKKKKKGQGKNFFCSGSGIACWRLLDRLSLLMLLRGTSRPTFILWLLIVFNLFFCFITDSLGFKLCLTYLYFNVALFICAICVCLYVYADMSVFVKHFGAKTCLLLKCYINEINLKLHTFYSFSSQG